MKEFLTGRMGKIKKKLLTGDLALWALTVLMYFVAGYLACVFPPSLVLDLFWEKTGQAEIEEQEYSSLLVGLPAGEGVAALESIEQYNEIGWGEYITFETDSIIPLDVYKLKSGTDYSNNSYRVGRYRKSSSWQWPTYTNRATIWKRHIYNRYYRVKLPDGNYVTAYLDDAYYWKYRLTGRVQLPLGYVDWIEWGEESLLQPYIEEYGLNEERLLIMFCKERYEACKGLHGIVQLVLFLGVMGSYIGIAGVIEKRKRKKKTMDGAETM